MCHKCCVDGTGGWNVTGAFVEMLNMTTGDLKFDTTFAANDVTGVLNVVAHRMHVLHMNDGTKQIQHGGPVPATISVTMPDRFQKKFIVFIAILSSLVISSVLYMCGVGVRFMVPP